MRNRSMALKLSLLLLVGVLIGVVLPNTAMACKKKYPQVARCEPTVRRYASSYTNNYYDRAEYYETLQTETGHQQAFEAYLEAAQLGDSRAAYRVAQLYEQGLYGTPRNREKAVYWYQQSNDSRAKYRLAQLAEQGKGMAYNPQQAMAYYTQAAELGDGRAVYRLSQNNEKRLSNESLHSVTTESNRYWLEESAIAGDGRSQYQLARAYHTGKYPKGRNLEKATYWYTKSALQGDTRSAFYLGQLYEFGGAGLANKPKAYAWYRIAKEQGHGWAIVPLARLQQQLKASEQWFEGVAQYQAVRELL